MKNKKTTKRTVIARQSRSKLKKQKPRKKKNTTKIFKVEKYLRKKRKLSSWQAINFWGATRLADIVYVLKNRKVKPMNIVSELKKRKDRYDNPGIYAVYRLVPSRKKAA